MRIEEYKGKLAEYFKKNLKKGYTEDSLRWALVKQGYSRTLIDSALERTHKELAAEAPILKEKPEIKYEVLDEDDKPVEVKKSSWWKFW